jgi:GNAT superfamily N-acetyltransferase
MQDLNAHDDDTSFVPFQLRDGTPVCIRAVRPDDRKLIAEGLDHLSPQSRYFRFLSGMKTIPEMLMQHLTVIDHHDHEAIGVLDTSTDQEVPAAIARYIRNPDERDKAEIAVTVVDDYQRRRLGMLLIAVMATLAQREGIKVLTAIVQRENRKMLSLLKLFDAQVVRDKTGEYGQGDVVALELPLHASVDDYADERVQQAMYAAHEIECRLHPDSPDAG